MTYTSYSSIHKMGKLIFILIDFSVSSRYAATENMYPTGWPVPYPLGITWISTYRWVPEICSHIQTYDLSDWFTNRHQCSLNSHAYEKSFWYNLQSYQYKQAFTWIFNPIANLFWYANLRGCSWVQDLGAQTQKIANNSKRRQEP